jgi:hypothetical protein
MCLIPDPDKVQKNYFSDNPLKLKLYFSGNFEKNEHCEKKGKKFKSIQDFQN